MCKYRLLTKQMCLSYSSIRKMEPMSGELTGTLPSLFTVIKEETPDYELSLCFSSLETYSSCVTIFEAAMKTVEHETLRVTSFIIVPMTSKLMLKCLFFNHTCLHFVSSILQQFSKVLQYP